VRLPDVFDKKSPSTCEKNQVLVAQCSKTAQVIQEVARNIPLLLPESHFLAANSFKNSRICSMLPNLTTVAVICVGLVCYLGK